MSVVITQFEKWLETVQLLLEKRGIDAGDLDVAFYRELYKDGLDPEQAVREDACLLTS